MGSEQKENNAFVGCQITPKDVYNMLWRCRDFELSTLWQRSIMLGTFMGATYAGYGAMILTWGSNGTHFKWVFGNLACMAICGFGAVFAVMWILMMKGSKAWYERYEAAINGFCKRYQEIVKVVQTDAAFAMCDQKETVDERPKWNDALLAMEAGRYSPSKVAIAVGQFSLVMWGLLFVLHSIVLIFEKQEIFGIIQGHRFCMAVGMAIGFIVSVRYLTKHTRTSTHQEEF